MDFYHHQSKHQTFGRADVPRCVAIREAVVEEVVTGFTFISGVS
jgi:hypothetical protein